MSVSIFISHSSRDQVIASALVELLEKAIPLPEDAVRCTSVEGYRLSPGARVDHQIRDELLNAKVFIGVLTRASIESAYVLFELGARWGADRYLAPVLAAGFRPESLVGPLRDFNAANCDSEADIYALIEEVAKELDVKPKRPSAFASHVNKLSQASVRHSSGIQANP